MPSVGVQGLCNLALSAVLVLGPGDVRSAAAREGVQSHVTIAISGTPMHGIEGITIGPDGALYVASITGRAIYRVEPDSGTFTTFVAPPDGGADDLTFGEDGTAVWTGGPRMDRLMSRSPSGEIHTLVAATPGLNAVRFTASGRLFFTRIFAGDGLYEADTAGVKPVRTVIENIGGLNAFDFAADGAIVGPLFMRGTMVRLDPETGVSHQIADGFSSPSAVRVLPDGYLVLNYRSGEIWRLDATATTRTLLGTVEPPADNFIVKDGRKLYVTSTAYNGITEIDLITGLRRRVTWSALTAPGMLAVSGGDGQERLLIADDSALRQFDPVTGELKIVKLGSWGMGIRGIAPLGDAYAIFTAYKPGSIIVVDPRTGNIRSELSNLGRPMGMLSVPGGLLVADYQRGEVVRLRIGDDSGRRILAQGLRGPVGLAVSASGSIFVSEYQAGRITELRPDAKMDSGYRPVARAAGLQHPEGMAMAKDGRLLVVDTGTRELIAIDVEARTRTVVAHHLAVGLKDGNDVADPLLMTGIAVTHDGTAFVSGNVDNVLYRISLLPRPKPSP
jgi:sugar lactone lactonase YvrE